jgi:hypothetical protein
MQLEIYLNNSGVGRGRGVSQPKEAKGLAILANTRGRARFLLQRHRRAIPSPSVKKSLYSVRTVYHPQEAR